jgi:hypothetical protein
MMRSRVAFIDSPKMAVVSLITARAFTPAEHFQHPAEATMVADDAGRGIVALVQKGADLTKADCNRAIQLAHRLTSELRTAEERALLVPPAKP